MCTRISVLYQVLIRFWLIKCVRIVKTFKFVHMFFWSFPCAETFLILVYNIAPLKSSAISLTDRSLLPCTKILTVGWQKVETLLSKSCLGCPLRLQCKKEYEVFSTSPHSHTGLSMIFFWKRWYRSELQLSYTCILHKVIHWNKLGRSLPVYNPSMKDFGHCRCWIWGPSHRYRGNIAIHGYGLYPGTADWRIISV